MGVFFFFFNLAPRYDRGDNQCGFISFGFHRTPVKSLRKQENKKIDRFYYLLLSGHEEETKT